MKDGDAVKVHYVGKVEGKIFDSSKQPFVFKLGENKVIKGFEEAVKSLKKGQKKTFSVPKKDGYGERNEMLVSEIPKNLLGDLGKVVELKKGISFELKDKVGNSCIATVADVKKESVILDLNHPLAGKDLEFEIELVDILKQ